ncbi:pseudouridine synthase, partial [Fennellomyces sp. T-0311]
RRIAFKVAYLGYNYYGFTTNHNEDAMPTIQGQLLKGLLQTKLIQDPLTCNFSLSGRTDAGVSGLGQVVALNVRQGSLPYIAMVNSQLPPDIRITAWASVPDNFDARFDCQSRTYHYYFPTQDMDMESMQQAAQHLIGHHDFRNFCKFNPSKNLQHYHRTILSAELQQVNPTFARLEIKGTAFLWHQVRCIVSILLLVGRRLESPSVVRQLLDISQVPGKPEYPLASSLPLLLYDCEFDGIEWQQDRTGRVHDHFRLLWSEQMTKALLYQSFVEAIDPVPS